MGRRARRNRREIGSGLSCRHEHLPVSPEDIRAAAEVHQELGPEYSDVVVAAFLTRSTGRSPRGEARLAEASRGKLSRCGRRRTLMAGVAMGACRARW